MSQKCIKFVTVDLSTDNVLVRPDKQTHRKKRKVMITTIEIDIYNVDVIVVIEEDWTQTNKKFKLGLTEEDLQFHAWTLEHPEYKGRYETWLLLKPSRLDNNTILHELLHIVLFIAIQKGIKLSLHNDEPLAYLQGYIGDKIMAIKEKYLTKSLEDKKKPLPL